MVQFQLRLRKQTPLYRPRSPKTGHHRSHARAFGRELEPPQSWTSVARFSAQNPCLTRRVSHVRSLNLARSRWIDRCDDDDLARSSAGGHCERGVDWVLSRRVRPEGRSEEACASPETLLDHVEVRQESVEKSGRDLISAWNRAACWVGAA